MDNGFPVVEVNDVNGIAHGHRVHAMTGNDPEALAEPETGNLGSHQPAQPTPVRVSDQ